MSITERFMDKIELVGDCWQWTASVTNTGYGRFAIKGKTGLAHRISYELWRHPIPHGMTIDHLCRNRLCVNPDHLEVVTPQENVLRGDTIVARNAAKTACDNGHPLSGGNLYLHPSGRRVCRACMRVSQKRHRSTREYKDRRNAGLRERRRMMAAK